MWFSVVCTLIGNVYASSQCSLWNKDNERNLKTRTCTQCTMQMSYLYVSDLSYSRHLTSFGLVIAKNQGPILKKQIDSFYASALLLKINFAIHCQTLTLLWRNLSSIKGQTTQTHKVPYATAPLKDQDLTVNRSAIWLVNKITNQNRRQRFAFASQKRIYLEVISYLNVLFPCFLVRQANGIGK